MKWYDYVVCFIIADFAAAMIVTGSWMIIFPAFWYMIYEDFRKWQVHGE